MSDLKHCHSTISIMRHVEQIPKEERQKLLDALILVDKWIGLTTYARTIKNLLKETLQ